MKLNKKLNLIGGLGVTGQALMQYFQSQKEPFIGFEEQSKENFEKASKNFKGDGEFFFGDLPSKVFESVEQVLVSPGVPLTREWIQEAIKRKIPISGELEFASQLIRSTKIGVTGTNGKSTTVSLLYQILKEGGLKTSLKGNIGDPLITAVMEPPKDCYVIEISSYQLETIKTFHPKIAILLNVTADHLDRYDSLDAYAEAKGRIFENQTKEDYLIYNADDPYCLRMAEKAKSKKLAFSLVNHHKEGGFVNREDLIVRFNGKEESYPLKDLSLKGLHNQENMLSSILAAKVMGISQENILKTLKTFKGLKHRVENVGNFRGMDFYDDSKGTNVGSVVMSLASFEGPIILILGGRDKGGDYLPLKSLIQNKVRALVVLGEAKEKIESQLKGLVPLYSVETMKEAVQKSFEVGKKGDVVLLSPACSSFDQYRNYAERGDDFKKWAMTLK